MDAQKIAQRLYESFASDDLCEHPEIVDDVEDLADEYDNLKAENTKLRELVRDAWRIASSTQCTACVNYDTCTGVPCDLKNRMQKLGIEVG